jgi:acetylornithine/succinyldiaminopimelate/putrescine aminotransferase
LNRVLNLQTGSLAAEAAIKMMLGRFYRVQADSPEPPYAGRTPVVLVMGDDDGTLGGNYHGTTIITQMMRGMWPELLAGAEAGGLMKVVAVRPNRLDDVEAAIRKFDRGRFKIAGFCHELVMMNYGGRVLDKAYVQAVYRLCRARDIPTLVDEIQSCLWAEGLLMFRRYEIRPTFVAIGKGFSGGEYAASRLLLNARMDCLPQFGALVTNGQEELASLAYLITMRWADANRTIIRTVGVRYQRRLRELARRHPHLIAGVEGWRHMASLCFRELPAAKAFTTRLADGGFDISVQAYKANCPPVALTKLPIIAGHEVVDLLVERMTQAIAEIA